jgi:hypothetical protein
MIRGQTAQAVVPPAQMVVFLFVSRPSHNRFGDNLIQFFRVHDAMPPELTSADDLGPQKKYQSDDVNCLGHSAVPSLNT